MQHYPCTAEDPLGQGPHRFVKNTTDHFQAAGIAAGEEALKKKLAADPWAHRSDGMRCKTCMWFVPKQPVGEIARGYDLGRCRRHAPTMGGYPVVYVNDWCGDHRVDENRV